MIERQARMSEMCIDDRIDTIAGMVIEELVRASKKFNRFNSPHEALAVIWEEFEEFKAEVFKRTPDTWALNVEAVQLAAMAMRYLLDFWPEEDGEEDRAGPGGAAETKAG